MKMETLYIHDGVAYLSKDLAILNGADKLSLHTVKLNETETENINFNVVGLEEMYVEDDYKENQVVVELNNSLEYLAPSIDFKGLSKYTEVALNQACVDYTVEFIFDNNIKFD